MIDEQKLYPLLISSFPGNCKHRKRKTVQLVKLVIHSRSGVKTSVSFVEIKQHQEFPSEATTWLSASFQSDGSLNSGLGSNISLDNLSILFNS